MDKMTAVEAFKDGGQWFVRFSSSMGVVLWEGWVLYDADPPSQAVAVAYEIALEDMRASDAA